MSTPRHLDESDRYSRLRLIRWWDQDRLRAANVLVVGAGAIGNEVLKNLALLGIGRITIVDFDTIEDSNLTRSVLFREADRGQSKAQVAARMLRGINPDIHVHAIHGNVLTDVGLGLFQDADLVIGCLDNREARLWVNRACWKTNRPWIDGGIEEINGVVKVFIPPNGPCYECGMTDNDYRLINLRYSCPQLRREEISTGKVPTTPTIASLIGGLQVQEALKLLHDLPVDAGHALVWNGLANNFYKTAYQRREDCLSHETYPAPIELDLSAQESTAQDFFAAARAAGFRHAISTRSANEESPPLTLHLDRDLILSFDCACGQSRSVLKPHMLVNESEAKCPRCHEFARPNMIHSIASNAPLARQPLAALGIPAYDIVRVADDHQELHFLLGGDRLNQPEANLVPAQS
jgi:adenylyltransferase/sulfurtransferase